MTFSLATQRTPFQAAAAVGLAAPFQIVERLSDGSEIPVACVMTQDALSREDVEKLAYNIKDFLNGQSPLHRFGREGVTLHYHAIPKGLAFTVHEHDADGFSKGNSVGGAMLLFEESYLEKFRTFCEVNRTELTKVLDSGSKPERRAEPRTHQDQRQRGKKLTQRPPMS